jgi:hypothetical protein
MNEPSTAPSAEQPHTFPVGARVYLRGARFGLPGVVLRQERGKVVIYWGDLDHISRHRPVTLMLAEVRSTDSQEAA